MRAKSGLEGQFYVDAWLQDVKRARLRSLLNGSAFLFFRLLVVGGSLVLPVLAGLNLNDGEQYPWAPAAILVVSLIVAVSSAAQQTFRYGLRWRLYQQCGHRLEAEGWAFATSSGTYKSMDGNSAFGQFFERVQDIRDVREFELLFKAAGEMTEEPTRNDDSVRLTPGGREAPPQPDT
jgi:hypothetical protein